MKYVAPIRQLSKKEKWVRPTGKRADYLFKTSRVLHSLAPSLSAQLGRRALKEAAKSGVEPPQRPGCTLCKKCGSLLDAVAYQSATVLPQSSKAKLRQARRNSRFRFVKSSVAAEKSCAANVALTCKCTTCGAASIRLFETDKRGNKALAEELAQRP